MMAAGATKQCLEGFEVLTSDSVDRVRNAMANAESVFAGSIADTERTADDLVELVERLERVHALSDRFSGVELSPDVEKMLEQAELHRVAV